MLIANNITMQFGAKPLFENVSVKFGDGNRYGLIGANGAGKSTFMKILAGVLEPSAGNVALDSGDMEGVVAALRVMAVVDARRAALLGQTAHDLALAGRWAEAFEAAWGAAEIERSYAGRPTKWRSLLCLVAQELVRSGHVRATTDPRVRSATEAPAGTPRARHEGRGRRQRS